MKSTPLRQIAPMPNHQRRAADRGDLRQADVRAVSNAAVSAGAGQSDDTARFV